MGKGKKHHGEKNVPIANYRFIPVNSQVVAPPLDFKDISHAKPLRDGLCGTINVTWTAETPICVGSAEPDTTKGEDVVTPFELGGKYALPGASIKGMLRSIVEIATFSHLGQINSQHHYGYRDFSDEYKKRVPANEIKAGWIRYLKESKEWEFAPAREINLKKQQQGFHYLVIDSIQNKLGVHEWKIQELKKSGMSC